MSNRDDAADERVEVVRLLLALADDYPGFGVLRRAERFVLEPAPAPARLAVLGREVGDGLT